MKKFLLVLSLTAILLGHNPVEAHHCSSHAYVTHKDYFQEDLVFHNCKKHSVLKETTVYFYSNGTRRTYITNTIYNSDGSVLETGCSDVKHFIYNKKHYFTYYKNKKYQIIDENGNKLTVKNYKLMNEIFENKFLVKLDKKYGVIDINEQVIVPIKFQKFEQVGKDLFLTKLNGYWGFIDSSNTVLVKNENEKIKPLYETFVLKKYGKYGLVDKNANLILATEYDNIKKLGEYILVEKDNKFGLYDSMGNCISEPVYKKIRLERNNLEGLANKKWQKINL